MNKMLRIVVINGGKKNFILYYKSNYMMLMIYLK